MNKISSLSLFILIISVCLVYLFLRILTLTVFDRDLTIMLGNVAVQVNKNVNEYMSEHGFHSREETQQTALAGQVTSLSSRDHPVYKLMCKSNC